MEKVESSKVVVAMDPGGVGFITVWEKKVGYSFYAMPKKKNEKGTLVYDPSELPTIIKEIYNGFSGREFLVGIEDVHSIAGSSAKANFNFGKNVGGQLMALYFLTSDIIEVTPKRWQADIWRGYELVKVPSESGKTMVTDTKATSIMVAKDLFPEIDLRRNSRCTTPDDNKADSLLICEHLKRKYL